MSERQRRRAGLTATAPATNTNTPTAPSRGGWGMTGAAVVSGAQRAQQDAERKRAGGFMPFRFYVKGGEECEIILLDESVENGFAFYEHQLEGSDGKWDIYEPCIKDFAECPVCAKFKDSSYVLMLSCLVLKPFTTKKGQVIPHSKMLLPVRITQFDLLRQLEASAKGEGKSLRGMYLVMGRSKSDSKAPRIGTPQLLDGGKIYDLIPEAELVSEYGHKEVKGDDGKVIRAANHDITAYDYAKLFPKPDVSEIIARYGGKPVAGSAAEVAAEFDQATDDIDTSPSPAQPATPSRTRRKAAPSADPFND